MTILTTMFSVNATQTNEMLGQSKSLLSSMSPLIKVFGGIFIAIFIIQFLVKIIPVYLASRRTKKDISFLEGLGYKISKKSPESERAKSIVSSLKKQGFVVENPEEKSN